VGSDLKFTVSSKSDGFLYLFLWDQTEDKIYRLLPNEKDGENVIKANGSYAVPGGKSPPFAAKGPGRWHVFSMLSEKPRDFSKAAFSRDGDFLTTDRKTLESKLSTVGLGGLLGIPQCAPGQTCPDHFAVSTANIAKVAAPVVKPEPTATKPELPVAKPAAPVSRPAPASRPAPVTKPSDPSGKKAPDSEREYMKKLNKDLDNLLGK
jgi:hypothetical protein